MKLTLLLAACASTASLCFAADPATPFNGKDLTNWEIKGKEGSKWAVGEAVVSASNPGALELKAGGSAMVNVVTGHGQSHDIYSKDKFGDMRLEVEVMVPKGSNSGIYVMGEYELQIFDSFGVAKPGPGDMGAIYGANVPKANASKAPGEWQKIVLDFQAPKFDAAGKKTASAKFVKVTINGTVIHENVEVQGPTPSCLTGKEAATGPIMFQGDHGAVAYRNIKVSPLP